MSLPTLTYFNFKGRAFPVRVLLFKAYGKDGWTNETFEFPAWPVLKPTTPLGSLRKIGVLVMLLFLMKTGVLVMLLFLMQDRWFGPVVVFHNNSFIVISPTLLRVSFPPTAFLTLPDGTRFAQSESIARYAGKLCGMYPSDPLQALIVDEASAVANEALSKAPQHSDANEMKRLREEYGKGFLAKAMALLEARVASAGGGPFLLGATMTYSDLIVHGLVDMIVAGQIDHILPEYVQSYPHLVALNTAVVESDLVKAYTAAGYSS